MTGEHWELPVVGFKLLEIWLSGETYLVFYDTTTGKDNGRAMFNIGGPASLGRPDGTIVELDGDVWTAWTPMFYLRYHRLAQATVTAGSILRLAFDEGTTLTVGVDDTLENWGLSGPGDLILVCPPGGGDPRIAGQLPPL
jgi:hypothetical protein